MIEKIIDGIPVLIRQRERPPRIIRIKLKSRKLKDTPLSKLSPRHKQALENLAVMGMDKKKDDLPPINVPPVKLNLQPQKPLEPMVCIPKSYETDTCYIPYASAL